VALGDHLARMHPALFRRATLSGSPAVGGGLEVVVAGRQVLDNTLASRLASAWQGLEAEVAARLFGEGP
jgi:vacuolar-type H+-ATPase subunit E/Vma4